MYKSAVGKITSSFQQAVFSLGRIQLFVVQDDSFCQKYWTSFGTRDRKKHIRKMTAEMEALGSKNRMGVGVGKGIGGG